MSRTFGIMNTISFVAMHLMILTAACFAVAADEPIIGFWSGAVEREGKDWRVEITAVRENGELKASITFVDLDVADVAFPLKRTENGYRLEKPQPSGNPIIFDGKIDNGKFAGEWTGFGVNGTFYANRGEKPSPKFTEADVSFSNRDVSLAGTVLLPVGKGPFPAVVITHGSSPNERTAYRSWAKHFANRGIAALIYDKRGSGSSSGDTRSASMEDLAADAVAGFRYLAGRSISTLKDRVAGHSQAVGRPLAAARPRCRVRHRKRSGGRNSCRAKYLPSGRRCGRKV